MFNVLGSISWLGVILATAASFILGGIWFAALFSRQYALVLGRDPNVKTNMTPLFMFGPMICTFFNVLTSAVLLQALKIEKLSDALTFGVIVGIGYLVSTMVNVAINPNFPRPLAYAALNAPYFLISSVMTCAILFALN